MNYRKQYYSYTDCEESAEEWSKNHPGHYYVATIDTDCYEVTSLSDYDGQPYYCGGKYIYPDD